MRRSNEVEPGRFGQSIMSSAVGAAEALSVGVIHLTERTLIEALHAVEGVGGELGSVVVRAARGSIKAAEDIGGDLVEVGKGVSRGVAEPARELGGGVARLASGLLSRGAAVMQRGQRKPGAKATARRGRRRSAA